MKTVKEIASALHASAPHGPEIFDLCMRDATDPEGVLMRHDPPLPGDGVKQRDEILAAHAQVFAAMRCVFERCTIEGVVTEIDGQHLRLRYCRLSQRAGGEQFPVDVEMSMTIGERGVRATTASNKAGQIEAFRAARSA